MIRAFVLVFFAMSPVSTIVAKEPDKLREALMERDRQFAAAAKERGLDGWMEFMADDVVRLQKLGGQAVVGKSEVRKVDAAIFADTSRRLVWEPTEAGGFRDGKTGFSTGRYKVIKKTDGGEEVISTGSYLTWWRQEADGSWRVILDTGAADPKVEKAK